MSDALSCIASDLLPQTDGVFIVFGLLAAAGLIGAAWGALSAWLDVLLDRAYRWLWRTPQCTPGHCYCRRTCVCLTQDEVQPRD